MLFPLRRPYWQSPYCLGLAVHDYGLSYSRTVSGRGLGISCCVFGLGDRKPCLELTRQKDGRCSLLSLIANLHEKLHNELFIRAGWDKFGSARFGQLIDMYTESKGSPEAFAPEELESLYQMIISKKAELIDVYSKIEANARDMAAILGWGYDARILGAILSVRSNILSFMNLLALPAHDQPSKKKIVEHYLDIEGSMSAW